VPDAPPPPEGPDARRSDEVDRADAVAALRAAFTRLHPQGSDAWNFLAAFTHLGDRYGPYQPGASDLSRELEAQEADPGRGRGWRQRLAEMAPSGAGRSAATPAAGRPASELELAMAQVVEAFRFLAARVHTLEERLAHQDAPVDGAAWLLPAEELGSWVDPVAAHVAAATPGGDVLHADCGDGALLGALARRGVPARGAEPRGAVAMGAVERGHRVTLSEVAEVLASLPAASLGGLVLSGVVDRIPVHAAVALLAEARRVLAPAAPIVIVASGPPQPGEQRHAAAQDLVGSRPLHAETWEVLLQRARFGGISPLGPGGGDGGGQGDGRVALAAEVPS
jgi:SAM-dependent methyltransferase